MSGWVKCEGIKGIPKNQKILAYGTLVPGAIGKPIKNTVELVELVESDWCRGRPYFNVVGDTQHGATLEDVMYWMPVPGRSRVRGQHE